MITGPGLWVLVCLMWSWVHLGNLMVPNLHSSTHECTAVWWKLSSHNKTCPKTCFMGWLVTLYCPLRVNVFLCVWWTGEMSKFYPTLPLKYPAGLQQPPWPYTGQKGVGQLKNTVLSTWWSSNNDIDIFRDTFFFTFCFALNRQTWQRHKKFIQKLILSLCFNTLC